MMERSNIVPHVSWSGPAPEREVDSYLLAMLLRIHSSGPDKTAKRALSRAPSVLTTKNLHDVSVLYAFYKEKMDESGVKSSESLLHAIQENADANVGEWVLHNKQKVTQAETELLEYVETEKNKGFSAFG